MSVPMTFMGYALLVVTSLLVYMNFYQIGIEESSSHELKVSFFLSLMITGTAGYTYTLKQVGVFWPWGALALAGLLLPISFLLGQQRHDKKLVEESEQSPSPQDEE
jgi:hypothetical protein